jgi:8-oxo-dGTP diphosphatase
MRVRTAGLIIDGDALLLVRHVKQERRYWLLPGGGVNLGEDMKSALKREIQEEVNLECAIGELVFVVESFSSKENHIIQSTYRAEACNLDELQLGEDRRVRGFGFFRSKEIESLTIYPNITDILHSLLENRPIVRRYFFKEWIR